MSIIKLTKEKPLGEDIAAFLEEHIADMKAVSPPESKHALDIQALCQPSIKFWIARLDKTIVGCGALMELDNSNGEIKSMRVTETARHSGTASNILQTIITEARQSGLTHLYLETGSMDYLYAARKFYHKFDFYDCEPFAIYSLDPNSVFMARKL